MQFDYEKLDAKNAQHIYTSKEAATGGYGAGGRLWLQLARAHAPPICRANAGQRQILQVRDPLHRMSTRAPRPVLPERWSQPRSVQSGPIGRPLKIVLPALRCGRSASYRHHSPSGECDEVGRLRTTGAKTDKMPTRADLNQLAGARDQRYFGRPG